MNVLNITLIDSLKETKIISGEKGLNNTLLNVSFIDAPDGYKWCQEGDFIITTGYFFSKKNSEDEFLNLLKRLKQKNCAGIGIKIGRYISEISHKVISFSNANHFPILSLPNDLSWSNISHPIISEINKSQQMEIENIHYVYKEFEQYLKNHEDLNQLANKLLSYFPSNSIVFYLRIFNKIITAGDYSTLFKEHEIEEVIAELFDNKNTLLLNKSWKGKEISIKWIFKSKDLEGCIFIIGPAINLTSWQKVAIEQSSVIISLKIEQRKAILNTFQQFRNVFISDLFKNQFEDSNILNKRAREMGLNLDENYSVLIMDVLFEDFDYGLNNEVTLLRKKNNFLKVLQNNLSEKLSSAFLGLDDYNYLVILIPPKIDSDNLISNIKKLYVKGNVDLILTGLGRDYPLEDAKQSYTESSVALRVAQNFYSENDNSQNQTMIVRSILDIGPERILFAKSPLDEVSILLKQYLKPLIDYDKNKNSELLSTLKVYLRNNGNIIKTSEDLIIHQNTTRYRLKIIEDLTNLKVKNFKDIMLLQLLVSGSILINRDRQ